MGINIFGSSSNAGVNTGGAVSSVNGETGDVVIQETNSLSQFLNTWNVANSTVEQVVTDVGAAVRITDDSGNFENVNLQADLPLTKDRVVKFSVRLDSSATNTALLRLSLSGVPSDFRVNLSDGSTSTGTTRPPTVLKAEVNENVGTYLIKYPAFSDWTTWSISPSVQTSSAADQGSVDILCLDLNHGDLTVDSVTNNISGFHMIGQRDEPAATIDLPSNIVTGHNFTQILQDHPAAVLRVKVRDQNPAATRPWDITEIDIKQMVENFNAGIATAHAFIHVHDNDFITVNVVDPATGEIALVDNGRQMHYCWSEVASFIETPPLHKFIAHEQSLPIANPVVGWDVNKSEGLTNDGSLVTITKEADYLINGGGIRGGGFSVTARLRINGVVVLSRGDENESTNTEGGDISIVRHLNVGDTVAMGFNSGGTGSISQAHFSVIELPNTAPINASSNSATPAEAAFEGFRALAGVQTVIVNQAPEPINYSSASDHYDTTGGYDRTTQTFTAPKAGFWKLKAQATDEEFREKAITMDLIIAVNDVFKAIASESNAEAVTTTRAITTITVEETLLLEVGDKVTILGFCRGGSFVLAGSNSGVRNSFSGSFQGLGPVTTP